MIFIKKNIFIFTVSIVLLTGGILKAGIIKFGMMGMAEEAVDKATGRDKIEDFDFTGFNHEPFDFDIFSSTTSDLSPYFQYNNTNHAEGPRKWYIYAPDDRLVKVYMPADGIIREPDGINFDQGENLQTLNGEEVYLNVELNFKVDVHIQVSFGHMTLRKEIKDRLDDSSKGYIVLEGGEHIGYIYYPPWHSLDFAVEDKSKDSEMSRDPFLWWNIRANPYDYFTKHLQNKLLENYQTIYNIKKDKGIYSNTDITDSRSNINVKGKVWGVWFKDDLDNLLSGGSSHDVDWSIINFVKKDYLHQDTYWKTINQNPGLSGQYNENVGDQRMGTRLYSEDTLGGSIFFILSGDASEGTARIKGTGVEEKELYFKYRVINPGNSIYDEKLYLESFSSADEARSSGFSSDKVVFRRDPG